MTLADFKGLAACGGFSYGDVLGAGEGWAKSILFNPRARDEFEAFFQRSDTFALGVCNGCQMMRNLHEHHSRRGDTGRTSRATARSSSRRASCMVEVSESPSILFAGMAGSRMPIVVAHGEGRAEFAIGRAATSKPRWWRCATSTTAAAPTETYPAQPERLAAAASPA